MTLTSTPASSSLSSFSWFSVAIGPLPCGPSASWGWRRTGECDGYISGGPEATRRACGEANRGSLGSKRKGAGACEEYAAESYRSTGYETRLDVERARGSQFGSEGSGRGYAAV